MKKSVSESYLEFVLNLMSNDLKFVVESTKKKSNYLGQAMKIRKLSVHSYGGRRFQSFRNVRLILLESIWKLFGYMHAKPHKVKCDQALTSLNKCREWLSDCLNVLEGGHKTVILFKLRNKFGEQILHRYVKHIKRLFRNYVENKTAFWVNEQKKQYKNNLANLLKGNVVIIDLAIQMLQLFMVTVTKRPKKSKGKKLFPTRGQDINNSDLSKVASIELPKSQNQKKNKHKQNIIRKSLELPVVRTVIIEFITF